MARLVIACLALVLWPSGCDRASTTTPEDFSPVVSLSVVGGNGQSGAVNTELSGPLVVSLTRGQGKQVRPIVGAVVNFVPVQGGGRMWAGAAITDENGLAADYWTLGPAPGSNRVEVRAVTGTGEKLTWATFNATAVQPSTEICDGLDNDLDGQIDEGMPYCINGQIAPNTDGTACLAGWSDVDGNPANGCESAPQLTWYIDRDQDAWGDVGTWVLSANAPTGSWSLRAGDCDDTKANVNPGAPEILDGLDNDCDGQIDEGLATPEVCDGIDNDLDGQIDEGMPYCISGQAAPNTNGTACLTGWSDADGNPANGCEAPWGPEICDGKDNDGNGVIDDGMRYCQNGVAAPNTDGIACLTGWSDVDGNPANGCEAPVLTWHQDWDADNYGNPVVTRSEAIKPAGSWVLNGDDCNDLDPTIHPGATEVADGKDNDCDGQIDEGLPQPEVCDGIDNDLDGQIDEGIPYCFDGRNAPNTNGYVCNMGWYERDGVFANGCESNVPPPTLLVEGDDLRRWSPQSSVKLGGWAGADPPWNAATRLGV